MNQVAIKGQLVKCQGDKSYLNNAGQNFIFINGIQVCTKDSQVSNHDHGEDRHNGKKVTDTKQNFVFISNKPVAKIGSLTNCPSQLVTKNNKAKQNFIWI